LNLLCNLLLSSAACWSHAQEGEQNQAAHRHHPLRIGLCMRGFISTWHMPDNLRRSGCCNNADCYPTEIKSVDGKIYAKRREDGKYILIPSQKIERNRDNPDGRNHLCAPPPGFAKNPVDTVYCFALAGPREIPCW